MNNQLQLRDWQQIKQAMALKYAGTPEGAGALAESRRYGLAADRIEELASQLEVIQEHIKDLIQAQLDSGDRPMKYKAYPLAMIVTAKEPKC